MSTVAALVTVGLVAWYAWSPWLAAWRYSHRLETVADDEAEFLLRGAAELGTAGIPVLVAGLASPRESVFRAAEGAIHGQLERWATLPVDEQQRRRELLAVRLAAESAGLGPSARRSAAKFAARILRDGARNGGSPPPRTMIACDHVLRASSLVAPLQAAPSAELLTRSEVPFAGDTSTGNVQRRPAFDAQTLAASPESLAGPAGGGLRALPGEAGTVATPADLDSTALAPTAEGARSAGSTIANSGALATTRVDKASDDSPLATAEMGRESQHAMQPARLDSTTAAGSPDSNVPNSRVSPNESVASGNRRNLPLTKRRAIELFADLHSTMSSERDAALEELVRRGFSPREIDVGRNLAGPDPYERKRWVQRLPGLAGIDAKPWLLMMSEDRDAGVRLAALTLMATSGDPETLRRAAEISGRDLDAQIQELATEIVARSTEAGTRRR